MNASVFMSFLSLIFINREHYYLFNDICILKRAPHLEQHYSGITVLGFIPKGGMFVMTFQLVQQSWC